MPEPPRQEPDAARSEAPAEAPALPVSVEIDAAARVSFAMHQNRVPLAARVALTNTGDVPLADLRVRLELANGEAEPWEGVVAAVGPGETYNLEPGGPRLDGARLASRTERERTALVVGVEAPGGAFSPAVRREEIDLLPFDHWGGLSPCPELLAAFVTPNHPSLAELLRGARGCLSGWGEPDAIDGYQSASRVRATRLAEACFASVLSRGLGYISPPASFERSGQRIRLADRLLGEGLGTCLDLSLLLAGLWEQAGLNALVLLFEDHALPAFWTADEHLAEPAIDDPARVRKSLALGELVAVESTVLTRAGGSFGAAVEAAARRVEGAEALVAVDIRTSRRLGVRPLPVRVEAGAAAIAPEAVVDSGPASVPAPVVLAERAGAGGLGAEGSGAEVGPPDRIDRWRRKLLDLTLRNRLLNFRETKRSIGLESPDIALLEDLLSDGGSLEVLPRAARREGEEDAEAVRAFRLEELRSGRVYATEGESETARRLLTMYRASRSSLEETGANILYVALGVLRWLEAPGADTVRRAPLILLPATLVRRAAGGGYRYRVELASEPLRPNATLIEKLRVDFGIDVRELEALPEDERGLDVPLILRRFREAVRDARGWEVEESAHLGLFSFSKYLMWQDLRHLQGPAGSGLRRHRLLRRLLGEPEEGPPEGAGPFPEADRLDDEVAPGELLTTRDADSSQLVAVRAARGGRTFVLEGPPGTGKSQTIANIIADALGAGRRALFVAEKMAALSVVRRRLEADGLGPFCLELHSHRASKKEVLAQLGEAMEASGLREPEDWSRSCAELAGVRARLNAYVRELHTARASGESVFEVIGRLSVLGDGPRVDLGLTEAGSVGAERLAEWRGLVEGLARAAEPVDPPGEHALRGIGRGEWSFGLPEAARGALEAARGALGALAEAVGGLERALGLEPGASGLSEAQARGVAAGAALMASCPGPTRELLGAVGSAERVEGLRAWIARAAEADARERSILERYRPETLEADLLGLLDRFRSAMAKPGVVRWWFARSARGALRRYCLGPTPALKAGVADLESMLALRAERRALAEEAIEAAACFGPRWRAGRGDASELEGVLGWAVRFRAALAPLREGRGARALGEALAGAACGAEGGDGSSPARRACEALSGAWGGWGAAREGLDGVVALDDRAAWGGEGAPGWLASASAALERWSGGLASLNDWCAWRRAREGASRAGLAALVEACEAGEVARAELGACFERSFGERWLVAAADASEPLRTFNPRAHESAIERFAELDREVLRLTRLAVAGRLAERAPSPGASVASGSEVGILRRELEKRSRHMPTRRLIESLPHLLPRLKPCFLMSPLSVAQYLSPEQEPFDLVVFDEASQIPVWDAIGSIARGAEAIVVGDSRQLPPTNFFSVVEGVDETDEGTFGPDDELESILQECNASGVPSLRLKWHYRSRHESLIAFSNHHYYDDELHTFPSPVEHSPELGVSFRLVEGAVYDRGGTRTNLVEAEAVAAEVVRRLRAPGATGSVGVVTFNAQQQGLIEDLLDAARREHPEIEPFFSAVGEPVFVKNLENVQGDERDTIVFSVGFGPDASGRVSMNFGPLNAEGGERRLNVAVTRARERLIVFCSMHPEAIDLSRTRAVGVHHFRRFLAFAQRGPGAIAEAGAAHAGAARPSALESAVASALEARGWRVDRRVGMGGYRIDLGVRDPEREGEYLVGVECDGPMYRSASTARDRERTRPSVLAGLGWRIARVWSTAWRLDPEGCLGRIERAIQQARAQRAAPPVPEEGAQEEEIPEEAQEEADGAAEPAADAPGRSEGAGTPADGPGVYRVATRPRGVTSRSDLYDERTTGLAIRALCAVVEQEQPVVPEVAMRRVAGWFGVSRITDRCRERFNALLASAEGSGLVALRGDALWSPGADADAFDMVRAPGEGEDAQRDLEWVPLAERAAAVRAALRAQIAMPREDLQREAARLLGVSRATARAREAMDEAIDRVLAEGAGAEREGVVALAE